VPTYEYACTSCGEALEVVQRLSDDPLTVCPACGGTLRKVFSPVGIVFKGSGFYRTDSRNGAITGGDKGDKSDKPGDKDKVTAAANGSGNGSSPDKQSSSGSAAKKPDTAKANGKKPAAAASTSASA
jgi:putative FmdB family regulatory protein